MGGKRKEIFLRILMGVILVPIAIYITLYASRLLFSIFLEAIILLAAKEMGALAPRNISFNYSPLILAGAIAVPAAFYFGNIMAFLAVLFIITFVMFLLKMLSPVPTERVLEEVSSSVTVCVLLPFLFSFFLLIRDFDPKWLLFLFFVIWASDTFAYFSGITLGKHKLIPSVSPGKSYEGLIGGFIGALAVAFIWNYLVFHIEIWKMLVISCDIIAAGVIGDLIESMIKRSASVKDSGNIIPGHGGIYDRFDSLVIAAPVLYFYLYYLVM